METWLALPGDPVWKTADQPTSKAEIIVWYRHANAMTAASNDLQARKMQRQRARKF